MGIESWSTTAASNNAAPPNGFPENQTPSSLNDCNRQVMASVRSQCENAEWFNWGDTVAQASSSTFTVSTDLTSRYIKGRRIKCFDGSTLYGTVTASSYSNPNTTVTVGLDSGSLTSSLSSVALAILSPGNLSLPHGISKKGTDIASASTTDLSAATGDYVHITGTTTITALGTADAGVAKKVRFAGALTLTHNSTSLILPTGANITTAAGDTAIFCSEGSGNWRCVVYQRANGTALAVSSTNPFADDTAIIKGSADATKLLRFEVDGFTTGTTRVITPPNYDLSFFCVQRVSTQTGAVATGTTILPYDDTIPQNTEGDQYMTLSITPKSSTNILKIEVTVYLATTNIVNKSFTVALFQDSTANAIACGSQQNRDDTSLHHLSFTHIMTAGTTSETTFAVRAGSSVAGTTTFNGNGSARLFGGVLASSIVITEYTA